MDKERKLLRPSRRDIVKGLGAVAGLHLLAPLAAACAPPETPRPTPQPLSAAEKLGTAQEPTKPPPTLEPKPTAKIESSPTTKPRPAVIVKELTPSPEVKKGILWQIDTKANFLYGKYDYKSYVFPSATGNFIWSGNRLFIRNKEGYVQEIDPSNGKGIWEWEGTGVPLAADEQRLFIQSQDNLKIYILNTGTKETINRIEPDQPKGRYVWPANITQDKFISLLSPSDSIRKPGVRVFDKNGKFLWETNSALLDIAGDTFIGDNLNNAISLLDIKSGQGPLLSSSGPVAFARYPYSFAHNRNVAAFIGTEAVDNKEKNAASLYDLKTRSLIWKQELPYNGGRIFLSHILGRAVVERSNYNYSGMFEYAYFSLKLDDGALDASKEPRYGKRVIFAGETKDWLFIYDMNNGQFSFNNKDTNKNWTTDFVVGIKYLGMASGNLIFANWDHELYDGFAWGEPKIYAVDPEKKKQAWKPVEIGSKYARPKLPGIVIRPDSIILVITNEILKIDARDGRVTKINLDNNARYVFDTGDIIFIQTEISEGRNRLLAFRP